MPAVSLVRVTLPTGAPPKPTGEQGTPTRPAGTEHHSCHRWQTAPSHTRQQTPRTHGTQSTLNSPPSSWQKPASEDDHWLRDKMGFPHRDTP